MVFGWLSDLLLSQILGNFGIPKSQRDLGPDVRVLYSWSLLVHNSEIREPPVLGTPPQLLEVRGEGLLRKKHFLKTTTKKNHHESPAPPMYLSTNLENI